MPTQSSMPAASSSIASRSPAAAHHTPRAGTGLATAVVGLQWGDEGKGKIVDAIAPKHDIVARYNGGANAGHSVVVAGERFALHLIPAGILHKGKPAVVGCGTVIDPDWILKEIDGLAARGVDCSGLLLSDRAHVVMPWHKDEDELRERWLAKTSVEPIGTTKRGIGPCYADKVQRGTAIRMGDLLRPDVLAGKLASTVPFKQAIIGAMATALGPALPADYAMPQYSAQALAEHCAIWQARLGKYITDTTQFLLDAQDAGKSILLEGANATLLDVDHGTYPYVTSSSTSSLGAPAGTGLPLASVGAVLGVMKSYSTRVGGGVMPTELIGNPADEALAQTIRTRGREFGTTTGRPRRVGWLDLVAVRYSVRLNGCTGLCLMLLDVLEGHQSLRICTGYRASDGSPLPFVPDANWLSAVTAEYQDFAGWQGDISGVRSMSDLPTAARRYIDFIEEYLATPISMVSIGPGREQLIEVK